MNGKTNYIGIELKSTKKSLGSFRDNGTMLSGPMQMSSATSFTLVVF